MRKAFSFSLSLTTALDEIPGGGVYVLAQGSLVARLQSSRLGVFDQVPEPFLSVGNLGSWQGKGLSKRRDFSLTYPSRTEEQGPTLVMSLVYPRNWPPASMSAKSSFLSTLSVPVPCGKAAFPT